MQYFCVIIPSAVRPTSFTTDWYSNYNKKNKNKNKKKNEEHAFTHTITSTQLQLRCEKCQLSYYIIWSRIFIFGRYLSSVDLILCVFIHVQDLSTLSPKHPDQACKMDINKNKNRYVNIVACKYITPGHPKPIDNSTSWPVSKTWTPRPDTSTSWPVSI